jgi:hypothetical protein
MSFESIEALGSLEFVEAVDLCIDLFKMINKRQIFS